jgi:hypothetical protein
MDTSIPADPPSAVAPAMQFAARRLLDVTRQSFARPLDPCAIPRAIGGPDADRPAGACSRVDRHRLQAAFHAHVRA